MHSLLDGFQVDDACFFSLSHRDHGSSHLSDHGGHGNDEGDQEDGGGGTREGYRDRIKKKKRKKRVLDDKQEFS